MDRFRKAIYAGLQAGLAAGIAALAAAGPTYTRAEVGVVLGAALVAAFTALAGVYQIRNSRTVDGSEPPRRVTGP